ncbi:hypothetical protein [Cognatishimia sp. F0-27]|uniref:hypothetical protein n=1 Tax=Cognatishimia sp. F0-27 TaxID=2816855 RepID=UPI001D0C0E7A|nr:hypothetical protein [Cognatishimia sp. F0-27]MCC1494576.1 hypothetical protein [Cognatishimia sp. F0-27]
MFPPVSAYHPAMTVDALPPHALSVRQPWAWAILHGGKIIENRSLGAIRAGGMVPGRIALHAATGMTEKEYRWGHWRLERHGVRCPAPADLPRGAIIGAVTVTGIITQSDSEWFGGKAGLTLADPIAVTPIPAKGNLRYFLWQPEGRLARPAPWMARYADATGLFNDLPLGFSDTPPKPF